MLQHVLHRHEPPVLASGIQIIYKDDTIVVVNKPPSVPVHATGRYSYNSLLGILRHELGHPGVLLVHRLDRLTSGICILARNKVTAQLLSEKLKGAEVEKVYVAKVRGKFPSGEVVCDRNIKVISVKLGLSVVADDGKPCLTTFKSLRRSGAYSIVECRPKTGRTHQIRVHLQYLGYPILNDPIYASDIWPTMNPSGYSESQICDIINCFNCKNLSTIGYSKLSLSELNPALLTNTGHNNKDNDIKSLCYDCLVRRPDPSLEDLYICLHSFVYSINGLTFEASLPYWASELKTA